MQQINIVLGGTVVQQVHQSHKHNKCVQQT